MQNYNGIDPEGYTSWKWKIEKLQTDEQKAIRYFQTIVSIHPTPMGQFIEIIERMVDATYTIGK